MSKSTIIVSESLPLESRTEYCQTLQSSAISRHSSVTGTPQAIRDWLTLLPPDSPVSRFPSPADVRAKWTREICGQIPLMFYESSGHSGHSWKTSQGFLPLNISEPSSPTWPRRGLMQDGKLYRLPKSERPTCENGSGLWPTPRANDAKKGGNFNAENPRNGLPAAVKMFPTPRANKRGFPDSHGSTEAWFPTPIARDETPRGPSDPEERRKAGHQPGLHDVVGGQLNPTFVEWLMGFPIGHTDLRHLGTDKFRQWLEKHGGG